MLQVLGLDYKYKQTRNWMQNTFIFHSPAGRRFDPSGPSSERQLNCYTQNTCVRCRVQIELSVMETRNVLCSSAWKAGQNWKLPSSRKCSLVGRVKPGRSGTANVEWFFHSSKLKNVGRCFRRLRFRFGLTLPDLLVSPFPEHLQGPLGVIKILCPTTQHFLYKAFFYPRADLPSPQISPQKQYVNSRIFCISSSASFSTVLLL
jgi:hypothetical protein